MWIVRLALRRPYTFVVAAMLVLILGIYTILNTPTDIFPDINIPVIAVAFNYTGMSPSDMETRIVGPFERIVTTTVSDVEHTESTSLFGIGIIKIFFQKNANIDQSTAEVTAISQTAIRQMPPGTQPPLIIRYSASDVPILQLSIGSKTIPESELFDDTVNFLRPALVSVPGVEVPYPYGGKQAAIMVDVNPEKAYAYGISPSDISNAVNNQSVILPAGTAKIGQHEYQVRLNASPGVASAINAMPVKSVNGRPIFIGDVANVRNGFQVQTSLVHVNGKPGILWPVLKKGSASTLEVVSDVRATLPGAIATVPTNGRDFEAEPMFDQSVFVRASVEGVIHEAAIAAGLTGLMILLFLGSWRSTLIVIISIPLSILVSIIILSAMGDTLNVMTLGGMALAVGILVDDATVEIENIHRNLHMRKHLVKAILDGAAQIAVPAFVSTLCICIVFVPVVFISGAAKFLFTPLALAVVFAMLTSYLLSRTLVPTMVHYLLASEVERYGGELDPNDPHAKAALEAKQHSDQHPEHEHPHLEHARENLHKRSWKIAIMVAMALLVVAGFALHHEMAVGNLPALASVAGAVKGYLKTHVRFLAMLALALIALAGLLYIVMAFDLIWRTHDAFNIKFEKLRRIYGGFLAWALEHRGMVVIVFACFVALSCMLFFLIGRDFFPTVDAGQMRMHVRAPAGTRIEETQKYYADVEKVIHKIIPDKEIATVIDNIGIPNSTINLALSDISLIGPADGEILIGLNEGHHATADYQQKLRLELAQDFPNLVCFFQPADISTQVLNFGLAASIDVQISGPISVQDKNEQIARQIMHDLRPIPGVSDLRLAQVSNTPDLEVNVDRTMAGEMGLTQRDVAGDLLVSLSSNGQTSPNFWVNPKNGVSYSILVQTPQYWNSTINALDNTPVIAETGSNLQNNQLLGNLATIYHGIGPTNITHNNVSPTFDVQMGVQGTDLGSVADAVRNVMAKYEKQLPHGGKLILRGQVQSMQDSFLGLSYGLLFAVVLVYLLMVINFQSWIDPLIILMALPGAMAGILWMLFATGTTISVPALMGAIMSIGVATSNSILMITFANDQRKAGMNAHDAALSAGITRLRPVIMTALAMIIGMLPMSLGLGEGGEQNAPLGRAVIGGLTVATFATLIFVPVVYSALRNAPLQTHVEEELR